MTTGTSTRRDSHDPTSHRLSLRTPIGILGALAALALWGCPAAPPPPDTSIAIGIELVADGLTAPVALAFPDDGSGRMCVVSQTGRILVYDRDGQLQPTPLLDLRSNLVQLNAGYDERGLLGLAFHPRFSENGLFFVIYNTPGGDSIDSVLTLSEFSIANGSDAADPDSERVILAIDKPQSNHNGGQLAFGPNGFLFIGVGDGGGVGDSGEGHNTDTGNAQDKATLLGKILRIDIDNSSATLPYAIPDDNPFVDNPDARPEIYALGLRNPWKFSIDVNANDEMRIFAGDVGQSLREEVNLIESGGNYGWRIQEGTTCFNPGNLNVPADACASVDADGAPLIEPIIEYGRETGRSVIGGFVYRGDAIAALQGAYVFGDFSASLLTADGRIFLASQSDAGWSFEELRIASRSSGTLDLYLYGFGRDPSGELYILTNAVAAPQGTGGAVYKLTASGN